jgi:hypothetical protein
MMAISPDLDGLEMRPASITLDSTPVQKRGFVYG